MEVLHQNKILDRIESWVFFNFQYICAHKCTIDNDLKSLEWLNLLFLIAESNLFTLWNALLDSIWPKS